MHHVQKHILKVLTYAEYARFRDMKPLNIDSNAYSYHLKMLQKDQLIIKSENHYQLSPKGLSFVDKISAEKFETRMQPKIITMLVAHDSAGKVLLWRKKKQPFINKWSIPNGKIHMTDVSVQAAAERETMEKIGVAPERVVHRAACSVRSVVTGELVSYVYAHIFEVSFETMPDLHKDLVWFTYSELATLDTVPAVREILADVKNTRQFFYKEYDYQQG